MPPWCFAGGATKRLIAFDFDGVVCDSVGESSISAFKVTVLWINAFTRIAAPHPQKRPRNAAIHRPCQHLPTPAIEPHHAYGSIAHCASCFLVVNHPCPCTWVLEINCLAEPYNICEDDNMSRSDIFHRAWRHCASLLQKIILHASLILSTKPLLRPMHFALACNPACRQLHRLSYYCRTITSISLLVMCV
jgi:hypothetical protein